MGSFTFVKVRPITIPIHPEAAEGMDSEAPSELITRTVGVRPRNSAKGPRYHRLGYSRAQSPPVRAELRTWTRPDW